MSRDALKTLFHPFESGLLPLPAGRRARAVSRRGAGFPSAGRFRRDLSLVQGFRPDFLACSAKGIALSPAPKAMATTVALVLCGRHRGENELPSPRRSSGSAMAAWSSSPAARRTASPAWPSGWASWSRWTGRRRNIMALAFWFRAAGDRQCRLPAELQAARTAAGADRRPLRDRARHVLARPHRSRLAGCLRKRCRPICRARSPISAPAGAISRPTR